MTDESHFRDLTRDSRRSPLQAILGDIGWLVWFALAVVVAFGTIVQVGAGVGFGSVAAPSTMLLAPQLMPGTMLFLGLASSALGAGRIAGKIAGREVAIAFTGRCCGAALAGWLLASFGSQDVFALLFAGLTLFGIALSVSGLILQPTASALMVAGFLSGLMATVTTIGGPPMALIYQHQPVEKVRATLNTYFAIGMLPPIVALWLAGLLDGLAAGRALLLLPAIIAGLLLAHLATAFIDKRYRSILLMFCMAAAIIIGVRALMKLM